MDIVYILLGLIVLVLGRKLFWLFVGIVGFVVGFNLASQYLAEQSQVLALIIALVIGLVGAVLAVVLQRLAAGLAGFLAGGYFVLNALTLLGVDPGGFYWLAFLAGGIVGGILAMVLLDWALILLSSLTGAGMIAQSVPLDQTLQLVLFAVLVVIGILVQAGLLRQEEAPPRRAAGE